MYKTNFCTKCGHKINPEDNFCIICGFKIENQIKDFKKYEIAIDEQVKKYEEEEKKVLDIVEKRFKPTEITYIKFTETIAECRKQFYNRVSIAIGITEIFHTPEPLIEKELKNELETMEKLTNKLTLLLKEFILNSPTNSRNDKTIDDLFNDLDELIKSVENYK